LPKKPSVARDIAKVLGAIGKSEGYMHGNGYVVTWAIGHLASLAQPHEIRPDWKVWRRESLPMLSLERTELNRFTTKAIRQMIIDHSRVLHPCIDDHGPDELETALLEGY
jgi:DNA topoisomerase IA